MHKLLLFGIVLLSISSLLSIYAIYRSISFQGRFTSPIVFFNILSFLWVVISILFRINTNPDCVKAMILLVGFLLAGISYFWLSIALSMSALKPGILYLIESFAGAILIILIGFYVFSSIITDLHIIESGLFRYKLSLPGSILFSFCFFLIFVGILFVIIAYGNNSFYLKLSSFTMFLSLLGVIFPWKEFGMNVIFISISGFLLSPIRLEGKSFL